MTIDICKVCRARKVDQASDREPMCAVCRNELDDFLGKFFAHSPSVETYAESFTIGLWSAAVFMGLAAAFVWFVKSGLAQTWWPL
jgi:hypothetical protein